MIGVIPVVGRNRSGEYVLVEVASSEQPERLERLNPFKE